MEQESNAIIPIANGVIIVNVFKRSLIAIWLVYLYILCMVLVMSSLSGSLFQDKLSKIKKANLIHTSKDNIETMWGVTPYPGMKDQPSLGMKDLTYSPTKPNNTSTYYSLNEIIAGFNIWDSASKSTDILKYSMFDTVNKKLLKQTLEDGVSKLKKNISELEKDISELKEDKTKNKEKYEDLGLLQYNLDVKMATLDFIILDENDPQLILIYLEVTAFNKFFTPVNKILKYVTFGTLTDHFWQYPRPILKLNLILSMGILGSLIFVTIQFIRDPLKHSVEMYFFRPFLGMIIALAIYVMVKSGLSTFSNDAERDLSPFFISFLGIISGMLAEQAYRRISFTGTSLFRAGTDSKNEDQQR